MNECLPTLQHKIYIDYWLFMPKIKNNKIHKVIKELYKKFSIKLTLFQKQQNECGIESK